MRCRQARAPRHTTKKGTTTMRKVILGLAAAAAIAAPLTLAGTANAATTDANGVVTVAKGEVMAQFPGMNEAAFQKVAMAPGESLTGSNVFTATTDTGVGCADGTVQHHERNTIITSPVTATEVYNASSSKVTGWTLGAKGASVITESNSYGTSPSGRFPNYATICADHGGVTNYFASLEQRHTDVTTFNFNGTDVSITVNPYAAPAA